MRLLMITGFGGSDLTAGKRGAFYNTLKEFHQHWNRIDIICPGITSYQLPATSYQLFGNVFVHPSSWPLWRQPEWILKKGRELHKEQEFNLMTVHEYPPFYNGIGARMLWNKTGTPYVLEVHHIPGYPKAAGLKESIYRWAMRRFIKYDAVKAKAVRVVNQKQALEFLIKAGVPEEKIKYMPSMYIDLDVFGPMPDVRKEYDLVFAGRLEKNKNVGLLLDALKILNIKYEIRDTKLLIIGDGPERDRINSQITNYKLRDNVVFTGWLPSVEGVAKAYNSAKIFVNPSLNEGGPRVALEAMACGLPVITTRVGIMNDIIKDGENGLFADWSPVDLAEKIKILLADERMQEKFSQAGLEIVRRFERKVAIRNYAENLKDLII